MIFSLPHILDKKIVYVGTGRDKTSVANFLTSLNPNIEFSSIDSLSSPEAIEQLKSLDPAITLVIKSPTIVPHTMPVAYTTATRIFFDCLRQLGARSIGVTGTKGKTTTAALLAHILETARVEVRLCGSSDKPMLDALEGATEKMIFVVELSSYRLVELQQSPDIAIITNLHRDHIDYHGSIEAYWEAKHNIIRYMNGAGIVVYNPETEMVLHWLADNPAQKYPIDLQEYVDMSIAKLIGDHNKLNYLQARKVAELLGVDRSLCTAALKSFEPIRHRLQVVRQVRDITFVDDAIGSTPEATIAGIEALVHSKGPIGCVLLGGVDRKYDFTALVRLLETLAIPKLVFFPDTGSILKGLLPATYTPEVLETKDMKEAVNWAAEHCPSGSICLLSTAAASSVLWSGYEEKGSLFQQAVMELSS